MKTNWDYSDLAKAYVKRPAYSEAAIDEMIMAAGMQSGSAVCDVGAGVAHLTIPLLRRGFQVTAVEPNDAMRAGGIERTKEFAHVQWFEGTGEETGQGEHMFDLVTFGSSFNVTDRNKALMETARILKDGGWFACMWNHRDITDPTQKHIEEIIKRYISDYSYGTRREDQTAVIDESGIFGPVHRIEGGVRHEQSIDDCVEAWRSHATLERQSGENFKLIVDDIEAYLRALGTSSIEIPYTTRMWVAKKL